MKSYSKLVAVGLFFGGIGDVSLELDYFLPGLASFLVGHFAYIAAFYRTRGPSFPLFSTVLFGSFGLAMALFLRPHLKPALVGPVFAYAMVCFAFLFSLLFLCSILPISSFNDRIIGPVWHGGLCDLSLRQSAFF